MIPTTCTLRPLTKNFEGLRTHNQLQVFIPDDLSTDERRSRGWLVHAVHKAARHYTAARDLVLAQIRAGRGEDGSARFFIWDFSLEMEDCVATSYKAVKCADLLARRKTGPVPGALELTPEGHSVIDMRNKLEHIFVEMGGGQTGTGPIVVTLDGDGDMLRIRDRQIPVEHVTKLLEDLFDAAAAMFPGFNPLSPPEKAGVPTLSIQTSIEVVRVPPPG
jgi:hypothetical protein